MYTVQDVQCTLYTVQDIYNAHKKLVKKMIVKLRFYHSAHRPHVNENLTFDTSNKTGLLSNGT